MKPFNFSLLLFFLCLLLNLRHGIEAQTRQAVMIRGNIWVTDNPGFGSGAITALFGEYRVKIQHEEAINTSFVFTVRVNGDPALLNTQGWQRRPGSVPMLQRQENGNLYIGYLFSGGTDLGEWTVIFCFFGADKADFNVLDDIAINRLIGTWSERFRYFFSLIKIPSDMSLPAVVIF
jgi:hypothetical protein